MNPFSRPANQAVLIVDDEPLVRLDLSDAVREQGFKVWEATNTADALAMLQQNGEACVGLVADINMPGTRSGVVLANHVRWMWPHIHIVVVSGARPPLVGALPDHVAFLPKPVEPRLLFSALHPDAAGRR